MRAIILTLLFLLTAAAVFSIKQRPPVPKADSLVNRFVAFDGWTISEHRDMGANVVEALELDDYLFSTVRRGADVMTLYIGYYLTAKKVGAAHDPMVCFPGQGWCLTKQKQPEQVVTATGTPIAYSVLIAEREGHKELVAYWFQAGESAQPDTLRQKVSLLRQRLLKGSEDNAFVRVTVSLDNRSREDGIRLVNEFIRSFYPRFLGYVRGTPQAPGP